MSYMPLAALGLRAKTSRIDAIGHSRLHDTAAYMLPCNAVQHRRVGAATDRAAASALQTPCCTARRRRVSACTMVVQQRKSDVSTDSGANISGAGSHAARRPDAALVFGYTLGGVFVVDWTESPVGPYREVAVLSGLVARGIVDNWCLGLAHRRHDARRKTVTVAGARSSASRAYGSGNH